LLKQGENVEVFQVQENLLFLETFLHDFRLLANGFGPPVDFLENHLHERRLELGEKSHLPCGLLLLLLEFFRVKRETTLALEAGASHAGHDPLRILVLFLLNVFLNQFWIETL
jgi:hypothetical protein